MWTFQRSPRRVTIGTGTGTGTGTGRSSPVQTVGRVATDDRKEEDDVDDDDDDVDVDVDGDGLNMRFRAEKATPKMKKGYFSHLPFGTKSIELKRFEKFTKVSLCPYFGHVLADLP